MNKRNLEQLISHTARVLAVHCEKLKRVRARLKRRDETLFKACVDAIGKDEQEKASIYACEIAGLRSLLDLVTKCELMLERVIIRLETIRDLSIVASELKPILTTVKALVSKLKETLPELSMEIEKINEIVGDVLATTSLTSVEELAPQTVNVVGSEEILAEARKVFERKIAEKLPKPPIEVETGKTMIALTSDGGEVVGEGIEPDEAGQLEREIINYIRAHNGMFDLNQCAIELGVPPDEIIKTLEKLSASGRIRIAR